LIKH